MPLAKTTSVNITFQEGHAEVIVEEISNPEVFSFEVSPGSSAQVAFKGDEKECSVVKVHFMLSDSPIEIGWTNLPEVFMEGLFVHYMTRKLA